MNLKTNAVKKKYVLKVQPYRNRPEYIKTLHIEAESADAAMLKVPKEIKILEITEENKVE